MKTKVAAALMAGMLFLVPLTHAAKTPAEQLATALVELDDLIKETDLLSFSPFLAPVLKAEVAPMNKMLIEDKVRLSDLVIAQLVADRLDKPVLEVLQNRSELDWAKTLEGAKVQLEEAVTYLEEIHTNVAFAMMDRPKKKNKKK